MTRKHATAVIISCEHAGNRVPAPCRTLLRTAGPLLETHRGYDIGALSLARDLAEALCAPLIFTSITRLLVDANRSRRNRNVFSEFTAGLSADEKENLLGTWYDPYRQTAKNHVQDALDRRNDVLHLSIHSFTPVFKGVSRNADIGFLYDPARPKEKRTVDALIRSFSLHLPEFRYRRNYPYRGIADSLTTGLRKIHDGDRYYGIEIEVNQKVVQKSAAEWCIVRRRIVESVSAVTDDMCKIR